MKSQRLNSGGLIDRSREIRFSWNQKTLRGFCGDTLASALMANGQKIIGRSFKYHRPRGIMSSGVEESGAIVSVGRGSRVEPNVAATTQELYDGLVAKGQNAWPNVKYDFGSILDTFGCFFSAGFYYKTFMGLPPFEWGKGTGWWMQYEKFIRKAAGMGTASREPDPDCYDHGHAFCDLLIVGSGPAGLSSAVAAAKKGMDVILVEQDFLLGGQLLNSGDEKKEEQRLSLTHEIEKLGVRVFTRTTAFGLYDHGTAGLLERVSESVTSFSPHIPRQRFWIVRANTTILATGAIERSIAFGNNDRPGVMTVSSGQAYLNRFGILPGKKIVIATNNDSVYQTAKQLALAGAKVKIFDTRSAQAIYEHDAYQIIAGTMPFEVYGRKFVKGVRLAKKDQLSWTKEGNESCDIVMISGGWSPVINLISHRGISPVWDDQLACFLPGISKEKISVVGSATGIWAHQNCLESGFQAVENMCKNSSSKPVWVSVRGKNIEQVYEVRVKNQRSKAFVDFQHDVTTQDIRLAYQEGFISVEHLKRYTTLGMGTDQGKMGNVVGLALLGDAAGKKLAEVGTTRFRPPYTPVAIGALAGRSVGMHFKALRRTPFHNWNIGSGAKMTEAGLWRRPWYFPKENEDISDSYIREAMTVRKTVGLCDISSLGKISIQGPDSVEFLNRVYTNSFSSLPVGKARYGIMLRDDGFVLDDGTIWHISKDNFLITTTTHQAGRVLVWIEELLQTRWHGLRVHATSVTDQWAGIAIAGPLARDVLSKVLKNKSIMSNEELPFMGVRGIKIDDVNCLLARISFSGELAYEILIPANFGIRVMEVLWNKVQNCGGCLYGLEALGTLRIEKGHLTSAELDGRVTIYDVGLEKMMSHKKPCIGRVLLERSNLQRIDRPQLVGIIPKNRTERFNGGCLLFRDSEDSGFGEGWVTAVTYSPALGHWIGLGFIAGGCNFWLGKTVVAVDPLRQNNVVVQIMSPQMFDPNGDRMRG